MRIDWDSLPMLLDRSALRAVGLSRVDVDRIFERLPVVALEESRKTYVHRADLEQYLEARTFKPGQRVRSVA